MSPPATTLPLRGFTIRLDEVAGNISRGTGIIEKQRLDGQIDAREVVSECSYRHTYSIRYRRPTADHPVGIYPQSSESRSGGLW